MKLVIILSLLGLASSSQLVANPIDKVVKLITELKAKVEVEGQEEIATYDKFACWCEETLATKAKEISDAKELIVELQKKITKLGADIQIHEQDIKQLKKDIAENEASQKEAKELRKKEYDAYEEEKTESEQCIGALEAAIKVLQGVGSKTKTKFLETFQEAQLLSTIGALRGVLRSPAAHKFSNNDLEVVRRFIDQPDDFLHAQQDGMSAIQVHLNPFGDYAPQSGQIQGVLKGMYDSFTSDLEKANAKESHAQKAFEDIWATKIAEEKALKATLTRTESELAEAVKDHADSKVILDNTKETLEADEKFFADTKQSCKDKAAAWATRTRIRAEELHGMASALKILSSPEAKATFDNATTTFLQISSESDSTANAFAHLRGLAAKFGSTAIAKVAAEVKMGGHFDKVIHMIDNMILKLKEEQEEDIKARDECERKEDENKKNMEDINFNKDKEKDKLDRLDDKEKELEEKQLKAETDINATKKTIQEMKDLRTKENDEYSQAVKDDLEAIRLIQEAIESLSRVYKENDKKMEKYGLVQAKAKEEPAAPPATWENDDYGGKKAESTGIIAILTMIKEDLEKEIKAEQGIDASTSVNFRNDLGVAEDGLAAEEKSKVDADKALAVTDVKQGHVKTHIKQQEEDLEGEEKIKKAIETDCKWVKEGEFDNRKTKRELETKGLLEAKHFLSGAVVLPPK